MRFLLFTLSLLISLACGEGDDELRTFTKEQLAEGDALKDGWAPGDPLYLCVLGKVYDVRKGAKHYGRNGPYNIFTGACRERAFATGCFKRDPEKCPDIESLDGLTTVQWKELTHWVDFYDKAEQYPLVGYALNDQGEAYHTLYDTEEKRLSYAVDKQEL